MDQESLRREENDRLLFDRIAERYAQKDIFPTSMISRRYLLYAALSPVLHQCPHLGTIVDVGCGTGAASAYLRGHYDRYVGIDQSEELIRIARRLHLDNSQAEFKAENVKQSAIPDESADLILLSGALHHMTGLDSVIEKITRIAKNKGFFLAIEPQNANPFIKIARRIRMRFDSSYSREQLFFSENELSEICHAHQIKIISVEYIGYFSKFFSQICLKPNFIFVPFAYMAVALDRILIRIFPRSWRKWSFDIAICGYFEKS